MNGNTEKKNQHYIPKFYLRNFSYERNQKQIGVYNINNKIFIQRAKLKTQGSKNFFYGADGAIEEGLAHIEGTLSAIIRDIIENKSVPVRNQKTHFDLLFFATLTENRNPVKIETMKSTFMEARRRILEVDADADIEKLVPLPSHEQTVSLLLHSAYECAKIILDLDYKLLINRTEKPFISSDFPVVKYNQYLEAKKWPQSKKGFGLTGLQIFIPLNHEITLLFYEAAIYKVGDRKKSFCEITN